MKFVIAFLAALPAVASATFISALPYAPPRPAISPSSEEWTEVVFQDTSMVKTGSQSVLTTARGRGVWFGNGSGYGDNTSWVIGSSAVGNQLAMSASFASGSADWSAYLYDGQHTVAFQFNPTNCSDNCYTTPALVGIDYLVAKPGSPGQSEGERRFLSLDTTAAHSFEWLLRGGMVSYRIDGLVVYSGPAMAAAGNILVIGDGSGSTHTGLGQMTLHGAPSFDNAPTAVVLVSTVPEPGVWALMVAGLAVVGAKVRRRRPMRPGQ